MLRQFHFTTRALLFVLLFALPSSVVVATPYTDLVVFGDSLSDLGNTSSSTLGTVPGWYYSSGRFSNGPVYSERLATKLGVGPLSASSAGGDNYAFGGGQTAGTGGIEGLFIDDVDEQVDDFLAVGPVNSTALFVVFAGANDLLNGQTNVSVPVNNMIASLELLISAEAKIFLIPNLPLLGKTPRFNSDPAQALSWNTLTADFNQTLATALDSLSALHNDVTIFRLDIAGLINKVVASPANFGLSNATDSAAPGLEPGEIFYNTGQIVSDPSAYLFWDAIHPTTAAHAILAERAFEAAHFAADFDLDGDVDSADLGDPALGWTSQYGSELDGADFLVWQRQLGSSIFTPPAAALRVPEPSTLALTLLCAVALVLLRSADN